MKINKSKILLILLLISAIIAVKASGFSEILTFDNLVKNREKLLELVNKNYLLTVSSYCAIYIAVAALSIPGATILTLAGAAAFGYMSIIYTIPSAAIGAFLAFLASRYIVGNWVQEKYGEKLKKFNAEIEKNGAYYLLSLRLIPAIPFFLINIMAGLTKLRSVTFFLITLIGILPGGSVYIYAGTELSRINEMSDIASPRVIAAFALLGLLSLLPVIYKKMKKQNLD